MPNQQEPDTRHRPKPAMRSSSDLRSGAAFSRWIGIVPSAASPAAAGPRPDYLLIPIPPPPKPDDTITRRHVAGSQRDFALHAPDRISLVGGDHDDRGVLSRCLDLFQGRLRDDQRDVEVLAVLRRRHEKEVVRVQQGRSLRAPHWREPERQHDQRGDRAPLQAHPMAAGGRGARTRPARRTRSPPPPPRPPRGAPGEAGGTARGPCTRNR